MQLFQSKYRVIEGKIILTSRFEATRRLFRDGPRNFEPLSDDEDDAWAGTPLSKLPRQREGVWLLRMIQQAPYTADLRWNRVSNLRPSGPDLTTWPPHVFRA
ncbi:hypothetical protein AVEN_219316-1 [Araneus ventricosus]|uniref:Uncharacterized protein n=1 Tax=Araneus ventricosus TaxID=182803 RepID=A0A4Y2BF29_ARAVE|nr:hypothetical protein AVEN_219316-1 [Araneus ventricosus]